MIRIGFWRVFWHLKQGNLRNSVADCYINDIMMTAETVTTACMPMAVLDPRLRDILSQALPNHLSPRWKTLQASI